MIYIWTNIILCFLKKNVQNEKRKTLQISSRNERTTSFWTTTVTTNQTFIPLRTTLNWLHSPTLWSHQILKTLDCFFIDASNSTITMSKSMPLFHSTPQSNDKPKKTSLDRHCNGGSGRSWMWPEIFRADFYVGAGGHGLLLDVCVGPFTNDFPCLSCLPIGRREKFVPTRFSEKWGRRKWLKIGNKEIKY